MRRAQHYCVVFRRWVTVTVFVAGAALWRPIVILRGRHSALGVLCCMLARISLAPSGDKVHKFRSRRGFLSDVLRIDGSLVRDVNFEGVTFEVHEKIGRNRFFLATKCENLRRYRTKCSFWGFYMSSLVSLVLFWRRSAYEGSCKSRIREGPKKVCHMLSCRFAWQAWHNVTFWLFFW